MFEVETGLIFWNIVSFAILVFLMYRWLLPPLLKMLQEREKTIADSLAAAAENRRQAEEGLLLTRQKIAEASRNAEKIIGQAALEGDKLKEDIVEASRKEAGFLLIRAKEDIQRERNEALAEVREKTADLVVAAAGRVLGKKIDPVENGRLIEESIKACRR